MEMRFVQNKKVLKDKLPQIKSALEAVEFLMSKAVSSIIPTMTSDYSMDAH